MPYYQLQGPQPRFYGGVRGHSDGAGEGYGCGEAEALPWEAASRRLPLGAEPLCWHMDGNQVGNTSPKGWGAQQLVLDPPADPCPLILEELFSLWLPPHDRHPLSENETLVYFPETNKKSQRCSGDWGTLRFWGLSGPEPLFIPSSNKQHFRVQEAFRGQVPFVFTVPVSWGNLALKKLSAQAYVNSQAVTISPSLLSFPFSWLFSLKFFSLFKISVPQNNRPRQINVLIHSGYLPV